VEVNPVAILSTLVRLCPFPVPLPAMEQIRQVRRETVSGMADMKFLSPEQLQDPDVVKPYHGWGMGIVTLSLFPHAYLIILPLNRDITRPLQLPFIPGKAGYTGKLKMTDFFNLREQSADCRFIQRLRCRRAHDVLISIPLCLVDVDELFG